MKLRTIGDTLNIRNAVEFLTNIIRADEETEIILDTEMGKIAVEVIGVRTHDPHDPNFGVMVYNIDNAPFSNFVKRLIRSNVGKDIRWYAIIPYANGQSGDFTRELVIRALVNIFMAEVLEDCEHMSYTLIDETSIDAACEIYKRAFGDNDYRYQQFNRDLCNLSVNPLRRSGNNFRSFLLTNRELIRIREGVGRSKSSNALSAFQLKYDPNRHMSFGGEFYRQIFALVVDDHVSGFCHTPPIDGYKMALKKNQGHGKLILPITLMKICLLDRELKDEEGDK